MNEFTASNGAVVNLRDKDSYKWADVQTVDSTVRLADVHVEALREFFQHERDAELGRWRWPEHPEYVVYPLEGGAVEVWRETTLGMGKGPGRYPGISRQEVASPRGIDGPSFYDAARAYFDAHPVRKPWHDAEPGEVWALDHGHGERAAIVLEASTDTTGRLFSTGPTMFSPLNPTIVSARRIWPEDPS